MTFARVRQGLETTLKTWADAQSPAIPVAWQNLAYTPPATRYLRAHVLPAEMAAEDLTGAHRRYLGIFQIDVCMPLHVGAGATETILAALDALYPCSSFITAAGLRILILRPVSPGPSQNDGTHFVTPVSVAYRADT